MNYTYAPFRLHVEEAEDQLVQSTETAIGLMKAVLENVSESFRCGFRELKRTA